MTCLNHICPQNLVVDHHFPHSSLKWSIPHFWTKLLRRSKSKIRRQWLDLLCYCKCPGKSGAGVPRAGLANRQGENHVLGSLGRCEMLEARGFLFSHRVSVAVTCLTCPEGKPPELLPWYLVVYLLGSWIGFQLVVPEMVAAVGPET